MTKPNSLALVDLSSRSDVKGLGKKAANIAEVATVPGVRTPKGFAIPGDSLDGYLANSRADILRILRALDATDAHQSIEQLLLTRPIAQAEALVAHLREQFPPDTLFAVRSSAHPVVRGVHVAEDSAEISLAGQYSSFLRVPIDTVPEAVSRCVASLFNARSIEIFDPNLDTTYIASTMTVLIQEIGR